MPKYLRVVMELDEHATANIYRIIEKVQTIDGPRDRITDHTYPTLQEAYDAIQKEQQVAS